jgi:UDP-N-acetylmuramoylalanine--D-glutamate ligase
MGESGLAMARWLTRQGAHLRVADSRESPPAAAELRQSLPHAQVITGAFRGDLLDDIELLALSPGLAREEALVVEAQRRGIPVTGEIELFACALRDLGARDHAKVIGITGTNGKTTVTSMAGAMGRSAGLLTAVAGNISPAALSALMTCQDAGKLPQLWVIELSSFQLETTESLDADAATVLNLSDDHLDRYRGLDDYARAKSRIFDGNGAQVLNRQDARVAAMRRQGRRVSTFGLDAPTAMEDFGLVQHRGESWLAQGATPLMAVSELPLAGLHNAANALAALALCRALDLPIPPLLEALRSFKGLPHRVERIADIDGVAFYDDSKGTNVGATVAALEGLGGQVAALGDRKIVLIAGGDGKGQDFSALKAAVARYARALVLIGRDGPAIEAAAAGSGVPTCRCADMQQAVEQAFTRTRPGDAVLLSPACASFDMYRNYAHRAEVFAASVQALARARECAP